MVLDDDIRDQAYQFFIQEAPELLQVIETELLTLRSERSTPKIHSLMRAAHSIKGGAACIGLDAIKTLAHRLEDAFKALHSEELDIDAELESLLLRAYDCLRLPLMEEINTGYLDAEQALLTAEPVFAEIEARLGEFLHGEEFLPSSVELGIDIALSIFEVDVAQGLERLSSVLADPEHNLVAGELRAQAEVFTGIGELLNLSGFEAIAKTTLAALDAHPHEAIEIARIALADFLAGKDAVLAGDRAQGGSPSAILVQLADPSFKFDNSTSITTQDSESPQKIEVFPEPIINNLDSSLNDIFGSFALTEPIQESLPLLDSELLNPSTSDSSQESLDTDLNVSSEVNNELPALDDIFGGFALTEPIQEQLPLLDSEILNLSTTNSNEENLETELNISAEVNNELPALDDIFGSFALAENNINVVETLEPASIPANQELDVQLTPDLENNNSLPALDDIFGGYAPIEDATAIAEPSESISIAANEELGLDLSSNSEIDNSVPALDDVFGNILSEAIADTSNLETLAINNSITSENFASEVESPEISNFTLSLDDVFGGLEIADNITNIPEAQEQNLTESETINIKEESLLTPELITDSETNNSLSLNDVFGNLAFTDTAVDLAETLEPNAISSIETVETAPTNTQEIADSDPKVAPSFTALDIDITLSLFESDVAEGIKRISTLLLDPEIDKLERELREQAELFISVAEIINLPGFAAIAKTTLAALDTHPEQVIEIVELSLADFQAAYEQVLAGDRTQGGNVSTALLAIANPEAEGVNFTENGLSESPEILAEKTDAIPALEDVFDSFVDSAQTIETVAKPETEPLANLSQPNAEIADIIPALEDVFGGFVDSAQTIETVAETETEPPSETVDIIPSLEDVFGGFIAPQSNTALPESPEVNQSNPTQETSNSEISENKSEILAANPIPSLEDVFGGFVALQPTIHVDESNDVIPTKLTAKEKLFNEELELIQNPTLPEKKIPSVEQENQSKFQKIIHSVEQAFDSLPQIAELPSSQPRKEKSEQVTPAKPTKNPISKPTQENNKAAAHLTVRVDLDRLERMNNLVGELAINRNGLSLQNEQLQTTVQELLRRFIKFQEMASNLRDLSDQMVVAPERRTVVQNLPIFVAPKEENSNINLSLAANNPAPLQSWFDSLEMDTYGELHSLLQGTLEEMAQLEEIVNDVALLAGQSSQTLEGQRQKLNHLREDLMWARMLPLGEVLSRFPRTLRDLSNTYKKPVELKLSGTGVLVDKAVLEKLYDPLLHLLRNAFDHGIESTEVRREQGKPEQGTIEIRAYHQGSQTVIEVRDDGKGINLERVREKAFDSGLLSVEQANTISTAQLLDLIFEPGFSTASKVSELSGRGVGLDVVRSQLQALKGSVTVSSTIGKGTVFSLRIPLTLTIAKLLVCLIGFNGFAFPADSIEEILIPKAEQIKRTGKQRFLHWRNRIVPIFHLSELLDYAVPLPEATPSQALVPVPTPEEWAAPILLTHQGSQFLALEIDRLVTEQELVIKPFGEAIAPPSYIYGCTILGDGSLIPVIDCASLINKVFGQGHSHLPTTISTESLSSDSKSEVTEEPKEVSTPSKTLNSTQISKSPLVLVVDDSIALRQTVALNLQKAGYRVLQARDGREALEQLQQNSSIQLVVSDVEMPNMNGFEFLNQRRQDPQIAKIPVIMLTSRSSTKHKQLATHLGASAYLTKPYLEQEFLTTIKSILDKNGSETTPVATH